MTTRTKLLEVRDEGTFIPVLAIKFDAQNEQERYLLSRSGYGKTPSEQAGYVLLAMIGGSHPKITCDAYDWDNGRTMKHAHLWLLKHWDKIESGGVLDVAFVNGETAAPKASEALEYAQFGAGP